MPDQAQIQKLTLIIQSFESIPETQKQTWITKLPTLTEKQFQKAEQILFEAQEKIQLANQNFLQDLKKFQKTQVNPLFQAKESQERQTEQNHLENILSQM